MMKHLLTAAVLGALTSLCVPAMAKADAVLAADDPLPRQADPGFSTGTQEGRLIVRRLVAGGPAAEAGLAEGDTLLAINGAAYDLPHMGEALLTDLRGDAPVRLRIAREGREQTIAFTPRPRLLEDIPGVTSTYGHVTTSDGARLRTIITRPDGARGKLHPVLFTQWVSCGTIEYSEGSGAREILASIARESGLALVRVERASDGDSQGADCHTLDYDTELDHYTQAFEQILQGGAVDASKVYLNGASLGSTTAPLIAHRLQDRGYDIAGIAVQGGGAVTYLERMMTFDRYYLERRPEAVAPSEIHADYLPRVRFQYEYLVKGRSPDEIAQDSAQMARVRGDTLGLGQGQHYGRPYAWHQQAATHNFLEAWAAVDAPVLVIFNEFEQFEARHGHKLIVDMVNRLRPGTATLKEQAGIGHSNYRYATIEDAYAFRDGDPAWQQTVRVLTDWFRSVR